ncbi:glycosyltransferase family 2 protein [Microbacterium sp. ARD31]|uniref:glycosyltransferase family 2 protein n=1 Tax=Microbacterium sp. ARD31 TaxID=2962576 RepID=UPI002880D620|nr:glycosyltransferase family 2 protein [Microbacterium sp. ARD31]MDT0186463.1 glycosyltransferase family 2 protein [Microbacterium sp. ARD31]
MPPPLATAVLIATFNRPDYLRTCLERLADQTVAPATVIVVDSSSDERSEAVAREHGVTYVRNPLGPGHTATSRMLGVALAGDADVIAFIDDDAFAAPDWLEQLLRRYTDPNVAGVGGRASNGQAGEENVGLDDIGKFHLDGTLSGHFAANPETDVDVDHLLGANMSLRLAAIEELGGIRDYYPGTCLREESEIALRARLSGWRLVYAPDAVVEHVAGPYAKGRRFDARYSYYAQRNHFVLLGRVVGRADRRFSRYLRVAAAQVRQDVAYAVRALGRRRLLGPESIASGVARGLTKAVSTTAGITVGVMLVLSGRIPYSRPVARAMAPISDVPE